MRKLFKKLKEKVATKIKEDIFMIKCLAKEIWTGIYVQHIFEDRIDYMEPLTYM